MTSYLFVILGAVLVNNVVLVRILGLCPFMGVSKKLETAVGMGAVCVCVEQSVNRSLRTSAALAR